MSIRRRTLRLRPSHKQRHEPVSESSVRVSVAYFCRDWPCPLHDSTTVRNLFVVSWSSGTNDRRVVTQACRPRVGVNDWSALVRTSQGRWRLCWFVDQQPSRLCISEVHLIRRQGNYTVYGPPLSMCCFETVSASAIFPSGVWPSLLPAFPVEATSHHSPWVSRAIRPPSVVVCDENIC